MRMRTSGGREVRLERSERTLRQQRPAGRATKWRVILYHRPNSKSLLNEQAFLHLQLMRMRTSGGREVRLERSERTLRQQRPAGRATKWRVILYHRPNSKSLLNEQAFLLLRPVRMRTPKVRFRSRRPAQAQRRRAPSAVSRPKTASKSQKTSLPPFPASCSLFCDIFHCIFLSMNRSFFAKLMAEYSIFRCAF